jgi:DNA invertase Pin-like site-specific DNA recombinase
MCYDDRMSKLVALYVRTSTDRQDKGLESQVRALEAYCQARSIGDYRVFSDSGVSGTKSKRPGLDKLLMECEIGNVERIIVYSFSRFARSTSHLLRTLEYFKQRKISFISVTENIDTSSPMGLALFTIVSAISQLERDLISERVKNGLMNAKAKGVHLGRRREVNDKVVLEFLDAGKSYREIAALLGISPASVCRVLKRRTKAL